MKSWSQWRDAGAIKNISNDDIFFEHYWTEIFSRTQQGLIDTWDYQWTFACWSQSMISIIPKYNQIYNLGFGEDATHTTSDAPDFVVDSVPQILPIPLIHPGEVKTNQKVDKLISSTVFGVSFFSFVKSKIRAVPLVRILIDFLRR